MKIKNHIQPTRSQNRQVAAFYYFQKQNLLETFSCIAFLHLSDFAASFRYSEQIPNKV